MIHSDAFVTKRTCNGLHRDELVDGEDELTNQHWLKLGLNDPIGQLSFLPQQVSTGKIKDKLSKESYLSLIHSDVFLIGQVLIVGYLTSLLLVQQLSFELRWFTCRCKDVKSLSLTRNVNLAHSGRHENRTKEDLCSIRNGGKLFLLNLFCSCLFKPLLPTL